VLVFSRILSQSGVRYLLLKPVVSAIFTIFTIQLSANLDSAVTARLDEFNAIAGNPIEYRLLGQTANDDGAILYIEPINQASGVSYPGVVDWAVGERNGNEWTIYLPGDPGYSAAYNDLPDEVLNNTDSTPYVPAADPTLVGDLNGYSFPWADGAWATVVRSYRRHGIGRIDFDLSGRDIVAAKDGIIVYADDHHTENAYSTAAWWYWNTIIIQHGAHEYSLYGHIAHDSIPRWIKDGCSTNLSRQNCALAINAGDPIAQEGSTGFSAKRFTPPTSTASRASASAATRRTMWDAGASARSSRRRTSRRLPRTSTC
jgi:hypothetical protein